MLEIGDQEAQETLEISEYLGDLKKQLQALLEIIQMLYAHGATNDIRNNRGLRPEECEQYGITGDPETSLNSRYAYIEDIDDLPVQYRQPPSNADGTLFFRRRPSDPELAASLDLIPDYWLLPPASSGALDELDQMLKGKLPKIIRELYAHHGGMAKQVIRQCVINMLPLRLMTPEEVMEDLWSTARQDFSDDPYLEKFSTPWADGRRTCFFGPMTVNIGTVFSLVVF